MISFELSMYSVKISLFIAALLLFILAANPAPVKAGCLFKNDFTYSEPGTLFLKIFTFLPLLSRYDLAIILRSKESKGKPNSAHFVIPFTNDNSFSHENTCGFPGTFFLFPFQLIVNSFPWYILLRLTLAVSYLIISDSLQIFIQLF